MLACSQLVDMVPSNDAKFFQCTQVVDEARHTEVLSRYLTEKCEGRHLSDEPKHQAPVRLSARPGQVVYQDGGFATGRGDLRGRAFPDVGGDRAGSVAADDQQEDSRRRIAPHGFFGAGTAGHDRQPEPGDMRELEDFTAEACRLVLRGQFPREAFETRWIVGGTKSRKSSAIAVENAKSNGDYAFFRRCSGARCTRRSSRT